MRVNNELFVGLAYRDCATYDKHCAMRHGDCAALHTDCAVRGKFCVLLRTGEWIP